MKDDIFAGFERLERSGVLVRTGPSLLDGVRAGSLDRDVGEGRTQYMRLREAARVLARLEEGWTPGEDDLRGAPSIERWEFAPFDGTLNLFGAVTDHPLLGDRPRTLTSPLIALDGKRLRWARTVSRWYSLGRPAAKAAS